MRWEKLRCTPEQAVQTKVRKVEFTYCGRRSGQSAQVLLGASRETSLKRSMGFLTFTLLDDIVEGCGGVREFRVGGRRRWNDFKIVKESGGAWGVDESGFETKRVRGRESEDIGFDRAHNPNTE